MKDKAEVLQEIIEDSKRFEFVDDEILELRSLNNSKKIYVNFVGLLEVMFEKLDKEDIDRILLENYE